MHQARKRIVWTNASDENTKKKNAKTYPAKNYRRDIFMGCFANGWHKTYGGADGKRNDKPNILVTCADKKLFAGKLYRMRNTLQNETCILSEAIVRRVLQN